MFRVIGSIVGFMLGLPILFPFGIFIGAFAGSSIGKMIDEFVFGTPAKRSNNRDQEDVFRKFYEQFYQNRQRTSYSGYTHGAGNGYTGFQSQGASDNCYSTIGCTRSDSNDDIKKSYRKMVSQYHPDRMAGKGLSSTEMERAENKFKEIQDSYQRIKKERGL